MTCFILFFFFSYSAFSQQSAGTVAGTVTDIHKTPIPSAAVTIISESTGSARHTTTTARGTFVFPLVPAGTYEIRAQAKDFLRVKGKGIRVVSGSVSTLNLELPPGGISETIVVEGSGARLDAATGTLRQVMDEQKISELPVPDRNVSRMILLAPGTSDQGNPGMTSGGGEQARLSGQSAATQVSYPGSIVVASGGGRSDSVDYFLDGGSNRDIYLNVGNPLPNPEAIRELVVQTNNLSAEYRSAIGGIVTATTRSGANALHGSVFEFLRNDALNAAPFFNNSRGGGKDGLKRNQFGAAVGGPILRDRLFFFGSYQGLRLRKAAVRTRYVVLTDSQRTGWFGGAGFPVNPLSAALLEYIPRAQNQDTGELFLNKRQNEREDQFLARFDLVSTKHQTFVKFAGARYPKEKVPCSSGNLYTGMPGYDFRNTSAAAGLNSIFGNSVVNSLTFAWNRIETLVFGASPIGMNDLNPKVAGIKEINVSFGGGLSPLNFLGRDRELFRSGVQVTDGAHWVRGRHDVAFGGDLAQSWLKHASVYRQAGFYSFAGPKEFILGNVTKLQQGGGEFTQKRYWTLGLYVNDVFRVTPRLTLNIGMRWDPFDPPADKEKKAMCLVPGASSARFPNAPAGILFGGDPGCPAAGFENAWMEFAPRLGFAFTPSALSRTVIRGGIGLAYQPPFLEALNNLVAIPPFSTQVALSNTKFDDPYGFLNTVNPFPEAFGPRSGSAADAFALPAIAASYQLHWKPPRAWTYNITLEHELIRKITARAAYVGAVGGRLGFNTDVNFPETPADLAAGRRPNSSFGKMTQSQSRGRSSYNALQLGISRSGFSGLSFDLHYTWSKTMDDVSSISDLDKLNVFNPLNPYGYWAVSDFDLRHRFVSSVVWEFRNRRAGGAAGLLSDWQTSAICAVQSGAPFSVVSNNNISDTFEVGGGQVQATVTGRPVQTSGSHGVRIRKWFDTAVFEATPDNLFGTSPRNVLTGPGQFLLDIAISKTTRIHEGFGTQFRAEFFNVLNHTNFYLPNNVVGRTGVPNPDFGRITNALDPRTIQLALKLMW